MWICLDEPEFRVSVEDLDGSGVVKIGLFFFFFPLSFFCFSHGYLYTPVWYYFVSFLSVYKVYTKWTGIV